MFKFLSPLKSECLLMLSCLPYIKILPAYLISILRLLQTGVLLTTVGHRVGSPSNCHSCGFTATQASQLTDFPTIYVYLAVTVLGDHKLTQLWKFSKVAKRLLNGLSIKYDIVCAQFSCMKLAMKGRSRRQKPFFPSFRR